MKLLIFGGSGFIGKALTSYLKEKNEEVKIVSRSVEKGGFALDISNPAEFEKIDFNPDVVINCASRVPQKGRSSQDPRFVQELFETNVVGGLNIANWAVSNKVSKVINCSTLVVVKKPWPVPLKEDYAEIPDGFHVAYSMSKLSQEQLMKEAVKNTETKIIQARLSAVYGEGMASDGIIFQLIHDLLLEEEVNLTDSKKNFIDLIHVQDVSRALYKLILLQTSDDMVFNVANGSSVSIFELATTLKKIINSRSVISNIENTNQISNAKISIEKLCSVTGFDSKHSVSLNEGLQALVRQYIKDIKSNT